jgi:hypothetical protein
MTPRWKDETRNSKFEIRWFSGKGRVLLAGYMTKDFRIPKGEAQQSPRTMLVKAKVTIRDFKDLEAWRFARELRREIYKLAKSLPELERFGLANQLRRGAISVTTNVAEGFGRFGYQENAQFCRQARGSML